MSKIVFYGNSFPKRFIFTGTWTCQVRLPIPSMQLLRPVLWYKADNCNICVVRRCGRLAPRQPLSVCTLLPTYERNRHLRPPGNLGHCLRRPRWIDQLLGRLGKPRPISARPLRLLGRLQPIRGLPTI